MKLFFENLLHSVKKHALILTIVIVLTNVILGGWTVFNNDIYFKSDIARDLLLLEELSEKGLILIGPRASGMPGLFHGPLWIYLNYPAYVIGHGNPIVVGYFWILLNIIFLAVSYIVAKKLFNSTVANIYTILLSAATIFYVHNLFNPYGAMMLIPLFLYTIIRYKETQQWKYLLFNLLLIGAIIQFQMAVGLPLLFLASMYVLFFIVKNKRYKHLLLFPILVLPLSTFILFDIRHEFGQLHAIINSFTSDSATPYLSYLDRLVNRWSTMTGNLYFAQGAASGMINDIISLFIIFFIYSRIKERNNKNNKHYHIYFTILYFYIGFYIISILFNGILLIHYTFPLMPLLFLLFSSMVLYMNRKIFFALLLVLIVVNVRDGIGQAQFFMQAKGTTLTSWQFQSEAAKEVFESANGEFGYFIYAPDYYGYAQKYAYSYVNSLYPEKKSYYGEKKEITYTVMEPAPAERPELDGTDWINTIVKIGIPPEKTIGFPNGFKINQYTLTDEELRTAPAPETKEWIHFR